jgi:NADPH2:quinone reductase
MAPHSTAVIYGSNNATDIGISFPAMLWNSYGLKFFLVYELKAEDRRAVVAEAGRWLEQGGLRHSIGPRFSLRDIAAAHEAVEDGRHIGNVVIDIA